MAAGKFLPVLAAIAHRAGSIAVVPHKDGTRLSATTADFSTSREDEAAGDLVADLSNSVVLHSNLGGQGPDEGAENLHIRDVDELDGSTDLIITVDDGSQYIPNNAEINGLSNAFGLINVKCGSSTNLRFQFVNTLTGNRQKFSSIPVTFYDFDQTDIGDKEYASIQGASAYWLTKTTQLVSNISSNTGSWTSSVPGGTDDNPVDHNLSEEQRDRCVSVLFENASTFVVTFGVKPATSNGCSPGVGGRTFLWDFRNALIDQKRNVPEEWSDPQILRPELIYHWADATVTRNNLGNLGPKKDGLRGMQLHNVGTFGGEAIDISVSIISGTYIANNIDMNGLLNGWGVINGACGSSVDVRFTILSAFEGAPLVLPELMFSFGGLDTGMDGNCVMSMTSVGFNKYDLSENSEIAVKTTENRTSFSGTKYTPGTVGPLAENKVDLRFFNVAEIIATLSWSEGGFGGRNMYFHVGNEPIS
eukprot:TRINITY_DN1806_c0_g1_i5.p1 TRINITY_DN1806_c0_g1~~TRINITY_DN1806_c0_g1_i5.p1  ORF type:complete len:501 (-),score=55.48 TRINITY_DN1806_c0_g1_i5:73-1497(-)